MTELIGYIALVHRSRRTYGIMFPDFPGCISAGNSFEDALANGAEALAFHVRGMRLDGDSVPAPRSLRRIRAAGEDWVDWTDAVVAVVPLIEPSGAVKPTNATFDSALLEAIDLYAERRGETRSAVLAEAARLLMAVRPARRATTDETGTRKSRMDRKVVKRRAGKAA